MAPGLRKPFRWTTSILELFRLPRMDRVAHKVLTTYWSCRECAWMPLYVCLSVLLTSTYCHPKYVCMTPPMKDRQAQRPRTALCHGTQSLLPNTYWDKHSWDGTSRTKVTREPTSHSEHCKDWENSPKLQRKRDTWIDQPTCMFQKTMIQPRQTAEHRSHEDRPVTANETKKPTRHH